MKLEDKKVVLVSSLDLAGKKTECTCTLVCLIHKIVPVTSKFKEGVMSEVTNQSINCCVTQITTWTTKDKHWKV